MSRKQRQDRFRSPLRAVMIYTVVSVAWIVLTDTVLARFFSQGWFIGSLFKGMFFVGITSVLLYSLIWRDRAKEEAIRSRLTSVFQNITDGVLLVNAEGRIIDANPASQAMLGLDRERLLIPILELGQQIGVRHSDGTPITEATSPAIRALQGHVEIDHETTFQRPNGAEAVLAESAAPAQWKDGQVSIVVVVLRDITEAKRFARMREHFLSAAAHELKTPLAAIRVNSELLQHYGHRWNETKRASIITSVLQETDRIHRLITELLQLSDVGRGAFPLHIRPFNLSNLVRLAVTNTSRQFRTHRIHMVVPDQPIGVYGDPELIDQVLFSLIENAIQYSPSSKQVELRLTAKNGTAEVEVQDFGIGIDDRYKPHVFEKFFRGSNGKQVSGGMGIGLYLSKEIIDRHGGSIRFESQQGKGTIFRFSLPLAKEVPSVRSA